MTTSTPSFVGRLAIVLITVALGPGCHAYLAPRSTAPIATPGPPPQSEVPRELSMVSLPPYVIEPPDILIVDVVKVIPQSPHYLDSFDVLQIQVPFSQSLPQSPITGFYVVDEEGKIDLSEPYGTVKVIGMTLEEARARIYEHLRHILTEFDMSISLAASNSAASVSGTHLVSLDGTINLGRYGKAYVAGLSVAQAKKAIEDQLAKELISPEVAVDVLAYNSKSYYIITEGGPFGDNVARLPITGNETVLDAISVLGGLSQISSTKIWISRPAPNGVGCEQVLVVNWGDITRGASTATNYQLLPGDRLFIAVDKAFAIDGWISRITRPFERMLGVSLLGTQMLQRISQFARF